MHEEIIKFYKQWIHDPKLLQMSMFKQHKDITTYEHSLNVLHVSIALAEKLHFNEKCICNIIVGAMLHDYFLYDYHITTRHLNGGIHAWYHPKAALQNAMHDFQLNEIQKNIIRSHMWPLTFLHPPKSKEAFVVSVADKICASLEMILPKSLFTYSAVNYSHLKQK